MDGRYAEWKLRSSQHRVGGGGGESPQGLLSTRPRDTTLVAKTDTSTPGISGVGFSAGLPVLFLYVNSSIVSSSLKVGIQRS